MLRDIALDAFEGVSEASGLAAVDALDDARTLAQIAKTSLRESVGRRVLARLEQTGGSHIVLVGGAAGSTRADPPERVRATPRSRGHSGRRAQLRFQGYGGVGRRSARDRDDLEQVAERAKNKAAAKRARQILRERDERAAQEIAAAQAAEAEAANAAAAEATRLAREDRARAAEDAAKAAEEARVLAEAQALERSQEEAREVAERAAREAEERQTREAAEHGARESAEQAAAEEAARRRQAEDAEARTRREGLSRMNQLIGRVEALIGKEDVSLKAVDRALRDVRDALADVPPLPSRKEFEEVVQRLKAAQDALTPNVRDLREVSEWQRWANVGIQEQLCEKMEALRNETDPEAIARRIHDLQQQWRLAADVPRPQGEALWRRFKTAHDELWARCEAHFAAQAEQRAENLTKKFALCERVEALADSSNWVQTAEEIKGLQAQWKAIGPVTRGQEKTIWERFRAACDRFFTRRQDDLAKRKGDVGGELREEGSALRESRSARRVDGLGTDGIRHSGAAGRVEDDWAGEEEPIGRHLAAVPGRLRQVLHALRATARRRARRDESPRARRSASSSKRLRLRRQAIARWLRTQRQAGGEDGARRRRPSSLRRTSRPRFGRCATAGSRSWPRAASIAIGGRARSALRRGVPSRHRALAGGLRRHRSRSRSQSQPHGSDREAHRRARGVARRRPVRSGAQMSPQRLAIMLKEALAANTIGGKVDVESRRRAAQEEVRQAQASWSRIGPVADEERRELVDRFQRALKQIAGH